MNEKRFTNRLYNELDHKLKEFQVSKGESLIYKAVIDENAERDLEYIPENPKQPKRGVLAFQTDILIKKGDLPLVVIEAKYNKLSTHDVLTYSTKALKHKDVYPHLRYGLAIGGTKYKTIPKRFFTHNHGFDFAVVIGNIKKGIELKRFINIVRKQIRSSKKLLQILRDKNEAKVFKETLEIK